MHSAGQGSEIRVSLQELYFRRLSDEFSNELQQDLKTMTIARKNKMFSAEVHVERAIKPFALGEGRRNTPTSDKCRTSRSVPTKVESVVHYYPLVSQAKPITR